MSIAVRRALAAGALVAGFAGLSASPASADQSSNCSFGLACAFTTPATSPATSDVFVASFQHSAAFNVDRIDMAVTTPPPEGCAAPGQQTDDHPTTNPDGSPSTSTTVSKGLSLGFDCNGTYDVQSTAVGQNCEQFPGACSSITWAQLTIAIPAAPVTNLIARPDSGGAVEVAWANGYSDQAPHDFQGFKLFRVDRSNARVQLPIKPFDLKYSDVDVPASGSYTYEVEAWRAGATPSTTRSQPVTVTMPGRLSGGVQPSGSGSGGGSSAAGSGAGAGAGSGSGSGPQAASPPATAVFGSPRTLPQDGAEPGDAEAGGPNGPRAASIKLGDSGGGGTPGEGLAKPFAAALAASVWAGLFLFLSRRATHADRSLRAAVDVEHVP